MYNFVGEVAVRSFGDFPEMEKDNLLTEIRNGNRAAFDELCREELPVLLSYARAFLYDKWADDVVQDVRSHSGKTGKVSNPIVQSADISSAQSITVR